MNQPWIEKYRPTKIKDIIFDNTNTTIINNMLDKNYYPNMLFYGPPGTGKTTTILCLMNEYQKKHNCNKNYIHLNASHERGIEVIRNHIVQFSICKTFFDAPHKFVLLDEMDSLTIQAQKQLFIIMKESQSNNITYILICNYLNKIIPQIHESLLILYFNKTSFRCDSFIQNCLKNENKIVDQNYIDEIKKEYIHDLRSIINCLQNYQKKNLYLSKDIFHDLLTKKNYVSIYKKITSIYDPFIVYCNFFMYLYEKYNLSYETIEVMRFILLNDIDEMFFLHSFLKKIKEDYIKN